MLTSHGHCHGHHDSQVLMNLTVPDTDGEPRRLDFVGHVETLREDLLRLLKIWKVPLSELTNKQRAILRSDSSRHHNANAHEGFAFEAGLELRRSILTNMTDEALGKTVVAERTASQQNSRELQRKRKSARRRGIYQHPDSTAVRLDISKPQLPRVSPSVITAYKDVTWLQIHVYHAILR